jgi:hypothetical protein
VSTLAITIVAPRKGHTQHISCNLSEPPTGGALLLHGVRRFEHSNENASLLQERRNRIGTARDTKSGARASPCAMLGGRHEVREGRSTRLTLMHARKQPLTFGSAASRRRSRPPALSLWSQSVALSRNMSWSAAEGNGVLHVRGFTCALHRAKSLRTFRRWRVHSSSARRRAASDEATM